jgi:hypothetical protein
MLGWQSRQGCVGDFSLPGCSLSLLASLAGTQPILGWIRLIGLI